MTTDYSNQDDLELGSNAEDMESVQFADVASRASNRSSSRLSSSFRKHPHSAELKEPLTGGGNGANTNDHEANDPFYVFREDLYRKIDMVDEGLAEYQRVVRETDTAVNTHVLKDTKKQLKRHLKNAESTWKDVSMTVQLVEKQRDKFPHIDNSELYERRAFISTTKDRLGRAKAAMSAPEIKQKLLDDERAKAARRAGMNDQSEGDRENTAFIADTQAQSSLLMQQQDETLDELGDAVLRVGEMAGNIQEEIGQQNKMLDEMEEDLSDAEEKLGLVMGKLGKMLKTKDRFQLITIIILTLVAIIMFFLVIYT